MAPRGCSSHLLQQHLTVWYHVELLVPTDKDIRRARHARQRLRGRTSAGAPAHSSHVTLTVSCG